MDSSEDIDYRNQAKAVDPNHIAAIDDILRGVQEGRLSKYTSHPEWNNAYATMTLLRENNPPRNLYDFIHTPMSHRIVAFLREENEAAYDKLLTLRQRIEAELHREDNPESFQPYQSDDSIDSTTEVIKKIPMRENAHSTRPPTRPPLMAHFSIDAGHFTPVYDSMKRTLAYRTLSPSSKLVLLDMLRVYNREWGKDSVAATNDGFNYTFSHCDEDVGKSTFDEAIAEIVERKFFRQRYIEYSGKPKRFIPAEGWKSWTPDETTSRQLTRKVESKKSSIRRNHVFTKHTIEIQ